MKLCKICNTNTLHEKGTFKYKEIDGQLFELTTSTSDALKHMSEGFNQFTETEHNSVVIGSETAIEYIHSDTAKPSILELFARSIRAEKCIECGHLIKLSRLP